MTDEAASPIPGRLRRIEAKLDSVVSEARGSRRPTAALEVAGAPLGRRMDRVNDRPERVVRRPDRVEG